MSEPASSVSFCFRTPNALRSWLPYFLAAIGAGAAVADEEIMRYYWVMPDAAPEKTPRVIRIQGEKGKLFEEVYADETRVELKLHPAILEARLARQAALRKEAQRLAKQLRESGKEPLVAYEEAWTEVYRKNWLNAGGMNESCRLDDMLTRLASEKGELNLTEDEQQWLLEALLEDDDRLESEAGLELLRRLAAQLRRMGYGNLDKTLGVNDELMKRFAEAMRHMPDSMNAFRDALFKTKRGSVGNHTLVGFRAPWGIKVGGGWHYHQAPLPVETTAGSGNSQLPAEIPLTVGSGQSLTGSAIVEIPGATDDFLVTSPEQSEKKEKDEEEDDTLTQEEDEPGQVAAAPAMMMRSFSMRSSAPATVASTQGDDATAPEAVVSDAPDILSWPSGSSVKFEDTANRAKEVQIDAGGVVADTVDITGSGYSFTGGNLVVTNRLSVTDAAEMGVTLDVGANRIQGGTLENVQMQVTGDIHRPVTDDYVTVHNLITSADGNNAAVLRNVALHAGTSTEYATLHKIAFAGESSLTGFVTFEKTQATGDMSVAAGGTLTLKNLTFDLRGVSMGEKTLFVIEDGGTLENWNADNVHFVYSGVKVNSAAVNLSKGDGNDGKIVLSADHNGHLYWNGADDNMWNISSANWSSSGDGTGREAFTALSNVHFGGGNAANTEISVTQDMVVAKLDVTDGGYSFSGARVAVLGNATFEHKEGAVTFNNQLVVQGGLQAKEGSGSVALLGGATIVMDAEFQNLTTTIAGDMTVGGKLTVSSGNATTAGSLTITGNVTAQEMEFAVSAGAASDSNPDYNKHLVNVSGSLTARDNGSITIGGTAAQYYTGTVTAGNLTVNTKEHDVYFSYLQVDKLTVKEGSTVHVRSSSDAVHVSSSVFPNVDLYGTLALDAPGVTYNGSHTVNVMSDAARLVFGEGCTIADLQIFGKQDNTGSSSYTDVDIEVNSRSATVTAMRDLGTLKVETGTLTVNNAGGAVHGELLLNNGKLQLGENTNDIMAAGSGAVRLENGGILDIGKSSQTLSANNQVFLSGASTITSEANGGLSLGDGIIINYKDSGNSIETKLTAEKDFTLNSTLAGSSLEISGHISGSGEMELTGSGSVVLSSANTDFSGTVTVQKASTLTLQNTDALLNAGVVLNEGATLALDAPDTVKLNALTLSSGSTLAISSIVGTDGLSAQDAALQVGTSNIGSNALTLNVHFADTLDTMTTYNIMSGLSSGNGLSLNVEHNGVKLDDSQYTLGVNNGVLYIYTMMGNVWDGGGSKIWSATGEFKNWSEEKYNEDKDLGYTAAIFRDLIKTTEKVTVQGPVSPGDIYFTAGKTQYELVSNGSDGRLAAGTQIHKIGKADVSLDLAGNASADNALGDVNVRVGSLILESDLAVKGTVSVDKSAQLKVQGGSDGLNMVNEKGEVTYTASSVAPGVFASLSGVTMDAAGIRGTEKSRGEADNLLVEGHAELSWLKLTDFEAEDGVTLSHALLTSSVGASSHVLENVTIGEGVEVDASGSYILSGKIGFDYALSNEGALTLTDSFLAEVGDLQYSSAVVNGKHVYTYQFIEGGGSVVLKNGAFTASQVLINGVNLSSGLATDDDIEADKRIVVDFNYVGNGSFTLSINGNKLADGTSDGSIDMPHWDARWRKTEDAPAFARRYVGTQTENGTSAESTLVLAAYNDAYLYSSIVTSANAKRVNDGKAFVVTLAADAKGDYVAGAQIEWMKEPVVDHEVWIYDNSGFKNIIGGLYNNSDWGDFVKGYKQLSDTHILVNAAGDGKDPDDLVRSSWDKAFVIAGSRWCSQKAESYVTVQEGEIYTIFGGSCGGYYLTEHWSRLWDVTVKQTGSSYVYVHGGRIGEIFAGGFYADLEASENKRAVEMVLTGGKLGGGKLGSEGLRIFGGADHATVNGDIYVCMEGNANVQSILVGGSNAGRVNGNIVIDLISGKANMVEAAGKGWPGEISHTEGNVTVNLYSTFVEGLGKGFYGGIYGGRESTNHLTLGTNSYISLHFAEGKTYNLASIADNGYGTSADGSVVVTGFDLFELEKDAHVVLGIGMFDIDMSSDKGAAEALVISGKGVVEVIGQGLISPIKDEYGVIYGWNVDPQRNLGRDIKLVGDSTLKISTSIITPSEKEEVRTITVTSGSTIDFSGFPVQAVYGDDEDLYTGLDFKTVISGNGVDDKGAIYKGKYTGTLNSGGDKYIVSRTSLPSVTLEDNSSVRVDLSEYLYMNGKQLGTTELDLAGYTLTKLGEGNFVTRNAEMTKGTVLVLDGVFGADLKNLGTETDFVLGGDAALQLAMTPGLGACSLDIRSLSGSGMVKLNGSTLTLHTEADSPYYYGEYMTDEYRNDAQDYDQFSETTGFGYAVFSGMISDAKGGGKLVKTGTGVHYISGSSSTYTGGTQLQEGRLYLLGTSEATTFTKDTSKAAAGVAGTGIIEWDSADAELYLGHGARIYNKGTTDAQGGFMTIGVEGVPNAVLAKFVVTQSGGGITVTMGGVEYVEIDTHNLKSIDVAAVYADGTAYAAGTDIDRNKMLLVKLSDWATAKDSPVTGFSATGYNEATYSGILADYSSSVAAGLHKVGVGTLELDQRNSYTGGTQVETGTLRLRGWGTVGSGEVRVDGGASLMLAYNGGYDVDKTTTKDDETIRLSNNMTLSGAGDKQWTILPEEDESQAASGATHSATDGLTAALISAVGRSVTFTLSGNIDGDGGVLHSGEGTLVLCGDSSYTGGTVITRGVVDVQSAFGLGATAEGNSAVKLGKDADLHVTVEPGSGGGRLVTTLATVGDEILGDVSIAGSKYTERVLHMADNGYHAATTTLGEKGTFLLCGKPIDGQGISSHSSLLTGSGTVVVSDALGSGTTAAFDTIKDYTGNFRVEGHKSSIHVDNGSYSEGSIHVAGQQASVHIGGHVYIAAGESLHLRSKGAAGTDAGTSALLASGGVVGVASGAVFSVCNAKTEFAYNLSELNNLSELKAASSVTLGDLISPAGDVSGENHPVGADVGTYTGRFDASIAVNKQAVGAVQAAGGLTLAGGATYVTLYAHTSLLGGSLTLDVLANNQITLHTSFNIDIERYTDEGQLVLFSDVSSVNFALDGVIAKAGEGEGEGGVYYTRADRYFTGWDYITEESVLVYDSQAGVVYLSVLIPEPTTTALSLLALSGLLARRRRRD